MWTWSVPKLSILVENLTKIGRVLLLDLIILVSRSKKYHVKNLPKFEIKGTMNYRIMLNFYFIFFLLTSLNQFLKLSASKFYTLSLLYLPYSRKKKVRCKIYLNWTLQVVQNFETLNFLLFLQNFLKYEKLNFQSFVAPVIFNLNDLCS